MGTMWRGSCVVKTWQHCREIWLPSASWCRWRCSRPLWSWWPCIKCGEACVPCKRRSDTWQFLQGQNSDHVLFQSSEHALAVASCLLSWFLHVCFYIISPEEEQSERWMLWQTGCRLNCAHVCLTAELGSRAMPLPREWWHQLLFFLDPPWAIETEVDSLWFLDVQGMELVGGGCWWVLSQ